MYLGNIYLRIMNKIALLHDYLHYYFSAKTKHGIHSPFVFDFVCKVLNMQTAKHEVNEIEALRRIMLKDKSEVLFTDYGAGSQFSSDKQRRICDIARSSLKSRKYAFLLHRMLKYFKPERVLELGTSLGITTAYMAKAIPSSQIITIEGCESIADIAKSNAEKLGLTNIIFETGNFDTILHEIVSRNNPEFIYFDGNHTEEATLRYFETCLPYTSNESIFVFDDINWSEGMKKAWNRIKCNKMVSVTIDLYFLGLVFFRKELSKENFVVRY